MYRRDTYNKKIEGKIMKKVFRVLFTVVLSLALCIPSMAAMMPPVRPTQEPGYLISSETYDNGDGTYSVEKVYTKHTPTFYSTELFGTDEFTKVKEDRLKTGSLIVSYQVTATFDWDTRTKKVKVYNEVGELTYNQGGDITKEKTVQSGNNTSKATAKYSFTRTTSLGFSNNYSVSISCNYKGVDS